MISLLIQLLLLVLIFGVIYWAITKLPIPEPFRTVAIVILVLVLVLILVGMLLSVGGLNYPLLR